MAEICIHFKNIVISALKSPFESADIGRTQTLFSGTAQQMQPPLKFRLKSPDQVSGAVRRRVIYDQNFIDFRKGKHCPAYGSNVLLFVVCRYDNQLPIHILFS